MIVLSELARRRRTEVVIIDGHPAVKLVIDGHELQVVHTSDLARFRLELGHPGTLAFEISSEVPRPGVTKVEGGQDVELPVGDGFNRLFVVQTRDVAVMQRIWTQRVADLMVSGLAQGKLVSSGTTVVLEVPWYRSTSVEDLQVGIEVLRAIGRMDAFGLAALGRIADGVYHDAGPGLPHVLVDGAIRIGPVFDEGRCFTLATVDAVDDRADEVVHVAAGQLTDQEAATRLGIECRPWLAALGTATVQRSMHAVEVSWPTVEVEVRHLDAGVALVRALRRRMSTGVFR